MKHITLLSILFFLLNIHFSNATIWTVNNAGSGAAQFTSLQAAINAASPGDTILVHPSSVSYGNITISKRLIIFGGGFFGAGGGQTILAAVTLQSTLSDLADSLNLEIVGFELTTFTVQASTPAISNVIIRRCNFTNSMSGTLTNSYFESCWYIPSFNLSLPPTYTNLTFRNCIFTQTHTSQSSFISSNIAIGGNNTFDHCVFYSRVTNQADIPLYSNPPNGPNTFNNCIFDGRTSFNNQVFNTFNYCMIDTVTGSNHAFKLNSINANTNFPGSNIMGIPGYTNYNPPALFTVSTRLFLTPGSPAIGAAAGGTDIGVQGGQTPFVYGGMPPLPIVSDAILINPVTPADENIQILIDAYIQQ